MSSVQRVVLDIVGKDSITNIQRKAKQGFKDMETSGKAAGKSVETSMKKAGTQADQAASKMKRSFSGLKMAAAGVAAGIGASLAAFATQAVTKARESEEAWIRIYSLQHMKPEYWDTVGKAQKNWAINFATAQGMATSSVKETIAECLSYGRTWQDTQKDVMMAAQLSAGTGKDMVTVYGAVKSALNGRVMALQKLTGLDLKSMLNDKKKIDMTKLRLAIEQKYGDSLSAYRNTEYAQMVRAENAYNRMYVQIGSQLVPVLSPFVSLLTQVLNAFNGMPQPIKAVTAGMIVLVSATSLLATPLMLLDAMNINLTKMIPTMAQVRTAVTGVRASIIGMSTAMKVAMATSIIGIIALIATLVISMQNFKSHTERWTEAEQKGEQRVKYLTKELETNKKQLNTLIAVRNTAAKQGKNTATIESQIARKREEVKQKTKELDQAEDTLAKNRETREALNQSQAKYEDEYAKRQIDLKEKLGLIDEKTADKQRGDLTQMGAANTEYYKSLQRVNFYRQRELGTLDKINKGTDNYSQAMKENKQFLKDYTADYDKYIEHYTKFENAEDFWSWMSEGIQFQYYRAKVKLSEFVGWYREQQINITKWGQGAWNNTVSSILGAWNWLKTGANSTWNNIVAHFVNAKNKLIGGWNSLKGKASSTWEGIKTAIWTPVKFIYDKLYSLYSLISGRGSRGGSSSSAGGSLGGGGAGGAVSGAAGGLIGAFDYAAGNLPSRAINWAKNLAGGALGVPGNMIPSSGDWGSLFMTYMTNLLSKFHYEFYFGNQKSVSQVFSSLGGNCVDLTNMLLSVANIFGLSGSTTSGYWGAIPHVWASIPGLGQLDPVSMVQNGSWKPPTQSGNVNRANSIGIGMSSGGLNIHAAGGLPFTSINIPKGNIMTAKGLPDIEFKRPSTTTNAQATVHNHIHYHQEQIDARHLTVEQLKALLYQLYRKVGKRSAGKIRD